MDSNSVGTSESSGTKEKNTSMPLLSLVPTELLSTLLPASLVSGQTLDRKDRSGIEDARPNDAHLYVSIRLAGSAWDIDRKTASSGNGKQVTRTVVVLTLEHPHLTIRETTLIPSRGAPMSCIRQSHLGSWTQLLRVASQA